MHSVNEVTLTVISRSSFICDMMFHHEFTYMKIAVCGSLQLVVQEIIIWIVVSNNSIIETIVMESERSVVMFPCGIKPNRTPKHRCEFRKFSKAFLLQLSVLNSLGHFTRLCPNLT